MGVPALIPVLNLSLFKLIESPSPRRLYGSLKQSKLAVDPGFKVSIGIADCLIASEHTRLLTELMSPSGKFLSDLFRES